MCILISSLAWLGDPKPTPAQIAFSIVLYWKRYTRRMRSEDETRSHNTHQSRPNNFVPRLRLSFVYGSSTYIRQKPERSLGVRVRSGASCEYLHVKLDHVLQAVVHPRFPHNHKLPRLQLWNHVVLAPPSHPAWRKKEPFFLKYNSHT